MAHDGGRGCAARGERGVPRGRPVEAAISRWIEDRSPIDLQRPVTSQRIMVDVLGLRLSDTDQRAANRVAAVMKRLGWVNRPRWIDGRTQRVWNRKDVTP